MHQNKLVPNCIKCEFGINDHVWFRISVHIENSIKCKMSNNVSISWLCIGVTASNIWCLPPCLTFPECASHPCKVIHPYLIFIVTVDSTWFLLLLEGAGGGVWGRVSIGGMGGTRHLSLLWCQGPFCRSWWVGDCRERTEVGRSSEDKCVWLDNAFKSGTSYKLNTIQQSCDTDMENLEQIQRMKPIWHQNIPLIAFP